MVTNGNDTNHGDHFSMYINIEPLWYKPEMNRIVYVNYNSIKINWKINKLKWHRNVKNYD